jgi:hypothetical protein
LFKGCVEGEQSLVFKESVGPFLMVGHASSESGPFVLLAQNGAQPSSNETIKAYEYDWRCVFEIAKPSP